VTIARSPEEVWEDLQHIERHAEWMADAESISFVGPQRQGVGTRFDCATKVGPIRLNDAMEITSWEPAARMGVRHQGVVTGEGAFTLTATATGDTEFRWSERLTFPWWLGGPIGAIVARPILGAIWRRNLHGLRQRLENLPR